MPGREEIFQQAMNQGHSAAWDGRWDRAATFYRQALEADPESSQALINLGLALVEMQEYESALKCYQRAAQLSPEDPLPYEKVAQISERLGKLENAAQAALLAAEAYLKKRDAQKAIENWERVTRLNPDHLQAYARLALVCEKLDQKAKAVSAYLSVASLMQRGGNPDRAMKAVQQALTILPQSDEAQQALSLLKDFKPLPKPSRPRGGTAPLRMSQVRQLDSTPDTIQPEMDPVSAARQKALTFLAGMLFDTAEEESVAPPDRRGLQALVAGATGGSSRPTDRTRMILHLSQVVDLQTKGEDNQAADELQRAVEAGLDHAAAWFDLGYLHARIGRVESAIRHLRGSVKHTDFSLATHLLLGDLLRKKNQLKEASQEYLQALKLADAQAVEPEQSTDLYQLYDLLIESQQFQNDTDTLHRICGNIHDMLMRPDWQAELRRARQQIPGTENGGPPVPVAEILVEARSSRVISSVSAVYAMMQQGKVRTAMEEAFYALEDAPTYLPLHALIAEMQVQLNNRPPAVEKFQVIARTYAMRGDTQQAISYARRVVELAPTEMNARLRLIDQLLAFGKPEIAIDEYIQMAEVAYSLADLNLARKTYTDALRVAQQTNLDRNLRIKILHRMADIDKQSLEWRQALRVLEQIRTIQPEDAAARAEIIALNFRLGQESQALAELDNYIAYLNSNNHLQALVRFLEGLSSEYPEQIPVRRRLVEAYRQAGRVADAISQLDTIGETFMQANDRPAAIQTIEMIVALNPPNRDEYLQLLEQLRRS